MASRRARLVLADQQHLFRQSLAHHLRSAGHVIVGEADTLESLDRCMIDTEPEIILLDRYLPGGDVFEYVHMLNTLQPQTSILLLVAYEHEALELQGQAFLVGASGCRVERIAVNRVCAGGATPAGWAVTLPCRSAAPRRPPAGDQRSGGEFE